MDLQWKFWRRPLRSKSIGQDKLGYVTIGDPDPTSDPGMASRYPTCKVTWADDTSQTLILPWSCTRKLGHQGQHIAGTGEWVAAVHPRLVPTATATSASV